MDLNQLEYIVTISEEKNISRAAEKLFVTQSALSQALKKLESDLGTELFERINHSVKLTAAGEVYVQAAKEILEIKERAYTTLRDIKEMNQGSFSFGCVADWGFGMFSCVYPKFIEKYPRIRVEVKSASLDDLVKMVLDGAVDIAYVTLNSLKKLSPAICVEHIDTMETVLAIPKTHRLAHLAPDGHFGTIKRDDLRLFKEDTWVLTEKATMIRSLVDNLFIKAGFMPQKILFETPTQKLGHVAVQSGIACSFVTLPHDEASDTAIYLHLDPPIMRQFYAIYRKTYNLSEAEKYFIELLHWFSAMAKTPELDKYYIDWP